MSDYQISQLVGMRTYCQLHNASSKYFPPMTECCLYEEPCPHLNEISSLRADDISMKQVRESLEQTVKTGKVSPLVENIVYSSYVHEGCAFSSKESFIWIFVIGIITFVLIFFLFQNKFIDWALCGNFTPDMNNIVFV